MQRLCVYCGSKTGRDPAFSLAAEALAAAMLNHRIGLVYGGAQIGLMGVLADAVIAGGGEVIGVIPESLLDEEVVHRGLTTLEVVPSMHVRKQRMIELADAMVALPGGLGTLEEFFEALTWAQLRFHQKPCGVLNVQGYFDGMLQCLDTAVAQGFLATEHRSLALIESEAEVLVQALIQRC
ncbi:MAG: TIGR00730 family Rossman fold protein [Synechococcus sp. MED850]|nr:TIGR00730 family Rossman fold protein [Synechococcus sp. MED850]OUW98398.1 MAG: Rossman fold protein, TIGR00730 family [Cyanobacteria bacterium TMED229]